MIATRVEIIASAEVPKERFYIETLRKDYY
jgi:hypothetical protein